MRTADAHPVSAVAHSRKRMTSCGASWMRKAARSSSRPKRAQILVEVAEPGRQCDRLDAGRLCTFGQSRHRRVTGGIGVAGDIEPAQASAGAAWRRGDWPKARRPSARSAARSAATAWSRCLRRRRARRLATPKRTALPRRSPIARRGVSIGALPSGRDQAIGSSQVRCAPVIRPSRSVTRAIIAGQVSVGACSSGR